MQKQGKLTIRNISKEKTVNMRDYVVCEVRRQSLGPLEKKTKDIIHDPEDSLMCRGCKEITNAQETISDQYKTMCMGLGRWLSGVRILHASKKA